MLRVVVAEDSPTARELLTAILQNDPGLQVVGVARDGAEVIELTERLRPDLVTMDVHMPGLDGIEATRHIMAHCPTPILVVSDSACGRDARLSLEAMGAGALMVVAKPGNPGAPDFPARSADLVAMVRAMAQVRVVRRRAPVLRPPPEREGLGLPRRPVRLVAIAASTGGPAALRTVLAPLPADFALPIVVVQHISPGFAPGLTDWLQQGTRLTVRIAEAGAPLRPGVVHVAPDDCHTGVAAGRIELSAGAPIGGFRPAASHLFATAARACGPALAAVILTGMGQDGVAGLREVRAAGGLILAQSEESSVVYGMPREAIEAGLADRVLDPADIARALLQLEPGRTRVHSRPRR